MARIKPGATAASAEGDSDSGLAGSLDDLAAGGYPGRGAEAPWQLSRAGQALAGSREGRIKPHPRRLPCFSTEPAAFSRPPGV